jgi:hypothetical protein
LFDKSVKKSWTDHRFNFLNEKSEPEFGWNALLGRPWDADFDMEMEEANLGSFGIVMLEWSVQLGSYSENIA